MLALEAFSGGHAFGRGGREWAEERPVGGRAAVAIWIASAAVGWLTTMLLVWASSAVGGG
jgi:hypothetical protein